MSRDTLFYLKYFILTFPGICIDKVVVLNWPTTSGTAASSEVLRKQMAFTGMRIWGCREPDAPLVQFFLSVTCPWGTSLAFKATGEYISGTMDIRRTSQFVGHMLLLWLSDDMGLVWLLAHIGWPWVTSCSPRIFLLHVKVIIRSTCLSDEHW